MYRSFAAFTLPSSSKLPLGNTLRGFFVTVTADKFILDKIKSQIEYEKLPDEPNYGVSGSGVGSDNKKDELLNELGWVVIRVSEKEIKTNINDVFVQILTILKTKPKINNHRIGLVVKPKKYQKKERNEFGFTEKQIQSKFKQRKVERPPLSVLLEQTKQMGFPKTGKLYNVSENTIRKWIKAYHKGLG